LAPLANRDEARVDDVHVVVDAQGELERAAALRITGRKPVAIEEAWIARAHVIEGRG
jgi:hypothetical protein